MFWVGWGQNRDARVPTQRGGGGEDHIQIVVGPRWCAVFSQSSVASEEIAAKKILSLKYRVNND